MYRLALLAAFALALSSAGTAQAPDGWEPIPALVTPEVWDVQALSADRALVTARGGLKLFADGGDREEWIVGGQMLYATYAPGGYLFHVRQRAGAEPHEQIVAWRDLNGGGFARYGTLDAAPGERVWSVVAAPDRRGWAAVGDAVYFYRGWGTTWERLALPEGVAARSLFRSDDGALWLGTTDGRVYRADGEGSGGAWERVPQLSVLDGLPVVALSVRPDGYVWAATEDGHASHGLSGGGEWAATSVPAPLRTLYQHADGDAGTGGTFAATPSGLFFRPESGGPWTAVLSGDIQDVDGDGDGIWAAAGTDGLRFSPDGGQTWRSVDWRDVSGEHVASTYQAGPDGGSPGGTLLVSDAGAYGLFTFSDGEWAEAGLERPTGASSRYVYDLAAGPDGRFYAALTVFAGGAWREALYRSDDGAATWTEVYAFVPGTETGRLQRFPSFTAGPGGTLLASVYGGPDRPHLLYRSADAGETWSESAAFDDLIRAIALGPDGRAYAAVGDEDARLYASPDGGRTWGEGVLVSDEKAALALVVAADGAVVVGLRDQEAARSEDGGRTWSALPEPLNASSFTRGPAGVLLSTGGHTVSRSADAGRTWTSTGTVPDTPTALAVGPDGRAYASTFREGFYRSAQTVVSAKPSPVPGVVPVSLSAARPHPASARATLVLTVAQPGAVRVEAFDVLGRRVAVLLDGLVTGETPVPFDTGALPAGPYVVRATSERGVAVRRVLVAR